MHPEVVYRVAVASRGQTFSVLDPADADLRSGGSRFDVPGAGVLYCCTELEGSYRETLARLRPSPRMRALDEDNENHHMRSGCVPASWREARRVFRFTMPDALPFLDVEHQATRTVLDGLPAVAQEEPLDIAHVRGPDRVLTRAIASWAYTRVDDRGGFAYAGIRYMSRLGDYECWAVFEGAPVRPARTPQEIAGSDVALSRVAGEFGLTIH